MDEWSHAFERFRFYFLDVCDLVIDVLHKMHRRLENNMNYCSEFPDVRTIKHDSPERLHPKAKDAHLPRKQVGWMF